MVFTVLNSPFSCRVPREENTEVSPPPLSKFESRFVPFVRGQATTTTDAVGYHNFWAAPLWLPAHKGRRDRRRNSESNTNYSIQGFIPRPSAKPAEEGLPQLCNTLTHHWMPHQNRQNEIRKGSPPFPILFSTQELQDQQATCLRKWGRADSKLFLVIHNICKIVIMD